MSSDVVADSATAEAPAGPEAAGGRSAAPFALAVFLGAFLLFQVQPLIGKYILTWFGGGPAVWTTCMLFFQVALLAGYAYAHGIIAYLPPRVGVAVHVGLLLIALVALPIVPGTQWKPPSGDAPVVRILTLLTATVGVCPTSRWPRRDR